MPDPFVQVIVEHDVPVPMRDGTVLRANVFRPDTDQPVPALLTRTPYGKHTGGFERFVRAGYAVASQDCRGRYASDGDWVPFTSERTPEPEDGYDSVEWLAAQPYTNGRIGTFGSSYNGWTQWALAPLRPPHLVAMCAYTIPTELTDLDFPGAFRAGRRVHWLYRMAADVRRRRSLPPPRHRDEAQHIWDEIEHGRRL